MFALSIGVGRVQQSLPDPVYALLSGLNASTVGIIALAAVQLSEGAIKDRLTRILVIFGALMGLCYTALWYFPVIMLAGGSAAILWSDFLSQPTAKILKKLKKSKSDSEALEKDGTVITATAVSNTAEQKKDPSSKQDERPDDRDQINPAEPVDTEREPDTVERTASRSSTSGTSDVIQHVIPLKVGVLIIVGFFCKLSKSHLWLGAYL